MRVPRSGGIGSVVEIVYYRPIVSYVLYCIVDLPGADSVVTVYSIYNKHLIKPITFYYLQHHAIHCPRPQENISFHYSLTHLFTTCHTCLGINPGTVLYHKSQSHIPPPASPRVCYETTTRHCSTVSNYRISHTVHTVVHTEHSLSISISYQRKYTVVRGTLINPRVHI